MEWMRDADEAPFVQVLWGKNPEELDAPAYVAVLRAKDPLRAEYLELVTARAGHEDPAVRARIAELRDQVDSFWQRMIEPHWLLGCGEMREHTRRVRFSYECPRTWAELAPSNDPNIRACDGCGETVHRCHTIAEAETHALAGHCISVTSVVTRSVHARLEPRLRMITGRPSLPDKWLGELVDVQR